MTNISPMGPIRPIFKDSDLQSSGPFRQGPNSGDQSEVEPPGPIPNPEVKRLSANGSGTIGPVRVGRRQVKARIQPTLGPGSFFARDTPIPPAIRQPRPPAPHKSY